MRASFVPKSDFGPNLRVSRASHVGAAHLTASASTIVASGALASAAAGRRLRRCRWAGAGPGRDVQVAESRSKRFRGWRAVDAFLQIASCSSEFYRPLIVHDLDAISPNIEIAISVGVEIDLNIQTCQATSGFNPVAT